MALWTDKYKPTSLDEYICSDETRINLEQYVQAGEIPNILLSSAPGQGKTSLAKLLVTLVPCEFRFMNCSDERSIDGVRDKIKQFCSSISLKGHKIMILDEMDGLTLDAQNSLKGIIEQFQGVARFIATTNHVDKILPAIRSRLTQLNVANPPVDQIVDKCIRILENEGITFSVADLKSIAKVSYPDIRDTIKTLQLSVVDGQLQPSKSRSSLLRLNEGLFGILQSKEKTGIKFDRLAQLLTDTGVTEYDVVYKLLYAKIGNFPADYRPDLIITIADYMKQSVSAPSKEITLMACLATIINQLKQ